MTLTRNTAGHWIIQYKGRRIRSFTTNAGRAIQFALLVVAKNCSHPRFISTPRSRSKKCGACGFITKEY